MGTDRAAKASRQPAAAAAHGQLQAGCCCCCSCCLRTATAAAAQQLKIWRAFGPQIFPVRLPQEKINGSCKKEALCHQFTAKSHNSRPTCCWCCCCCLLPSLLLTPRFICCCTHAALPVVGCGRGGSGHCPNLFHLLKFNIYTKRIFLQKNVSTS